MAQQRIHQATQDKLIELKDSINVCRVADGLKKLSVPDVMHEVVLMFIHQRKTIMKESK